MAQAYRADLVFLDGEFKPDHGLLVGDDGRIARVLEPGEETDHRVTQLDGKAILPGFVNAHSHTFQRLIRGRTETRGVGGDDFWSWREPMYRAALSVDADDVYHVARMTFLEMVMAGTTTVGEFHYLHRAPDGRPYNDPNLLAKKIIAAAESVGLRVALLRVAYARAGHQLPPHPGQRRFYEAPEEYLANSSALREELRGSQVSWLGVAPHSIRAVPLPQLEEIVAWARERDLPVHIHAAEQKAELTACRREYGTTPVNLLAKQRLLSAETTLVHAIHLTDQELDQIADANSVICSCPTTERNLGDGIIDAAKAASRGIRLAFGSDSQAQIDPLEDARELECHLRLQMEKRAVLDEISGCNLSQRLCHYATAGGAESLG
ncbi:MAG: formimidoylglutamate deiminase, partial [Acidobacteriaceae bacterium]|nr:formimidoylglutamate deiminase [Acidobacteriaceae bacterium]